MPRAGPRERSLGHVDPYHRRAGPGQHRAELARAAPDVKRALPRPHLTQQEPRAQCERGRLKLVRQTLPQVLVIVPDRATVA